ncbi:ABC transporter substrate-binding protein [Massilia cavernae]|uniref:ABC transporter substrate-binding protein n=1 Tax=Massilia cavernae TaxID=2320864 RepID=A0A418XRN7_9BURK|nr:ABC transporter substrate-binding protein [Massilia cavernae]RJG15210.1 ABC transporter substrate-binding protein [Massilia cavernae]
MTSPKLLATLLASASILAAPFSAAQVPAGYPAAYAKTVEAAKKEGRLVIYATTDTKIAGSLLKDFKAMYPDIKVEYNDMNSTEMYSRFISEAAAGGSSADLLWNSGMDLQMKLVAEGFALPYKSPEAAAIPAWANYQDMAFGTTFEPAVIVYNKRLVPAGDVPASHAALLALLKAKPDKYKDKVTTYDIEKSGVGFLLTTHDSMENKQFWDLAAAMGKAGVRVQSSNGTMMERISSGEQLIGYNILGSYVHARAKQDTSLGYAVPSDYVLVLSRVMSINKTARNPNAAKLWLDYTLSKRGQTIIANDAQLFSIRADVLGEATAAGLVRLHGARLKPIPVHPSILASMEQSKRLAFIKRWKEATGKK